jgi:hypothetical protein
MKLKYVTLTGADDAVNGEEMLAISEQYPFVEWGILFSKSKIGQSRYPSRDWVEQFAAVPIINFSAHLCGKWVEESLGGEIAFLEESYSKLFRRIQFNMGRERLSSSFLNSKFVSAVRDSHDKNYMSFIFGGGYNVSPPAKTFIENGICPLFDASGGRGIKAKEWPKPIEGVFCGYAGGLGPDNLKEELKRIEEVVEGREVWIDMESGIRTEDRLDLDKCRKVLEICQDWV